ncbi:MAG: iron-sulfur cluster assembly scaffold protein, partial [Pyrinomonadaceae bacterium]
MQSRTLAELFFNPTNVGDATEPSFVGRSASFQCGAALRISLHIDASQRITEAKFKAAGCSVLVASASLLIDQILGKTTGEAAAIGQHAGSIKEQLGAMDAGRAECSAIACEALVAAIQTYSDRVRDSWDGDQVLICT